MAYPKHASLSRLMISPEEARDRLVQELQLTDFDFKTQQSLVETALEALMREVLVSVYSYLPESAYAKIEMLAEEGRDKDVEVLITKHVKPKKIAEIIDGIFTEGVKRYKELLRENDVR